MAYSVIDIAKKLLAKAASDDAGERMSNLKLQKMLYYMQGYHLAAFNEPLFTEDIEAWYYGPVVPIVYHKYKKFSNRGIPPPEDDIIYLSDEEENLFDQIYDVYGAYSALGLMNMTHKENPWLSTETGAGNVISHAKMKSFFKRKLN